MKFSPNIVVFSGAGISAESGISTFRDSGGLWEKYDIRDVATPEAWTKNPRLVLDFYNQRRKQVLEAEPNQAHIALAKLQDYFKVQIITQNVDDLHERAGSKNVLHLHGEITKARSTKNPHLIYPLNGWELKFGDVCELGSQLRPHIVWFGEMVPEMERAQELAADADIFIIVGTSLNVYPAAGLVHYTAEQCSKFIIDPNEIQNNLIHNIEYIREKAGTGLPVLVDRIIQQYK
ncbi:MAG: NAD-dependent deacetylase [Bacteroidia bacterium]